MTADSTDILAQIDGAITDYSVSPDAMRWTPDAPTLLDDSFARDVLYGAFTLTCDDAPLTSLTHSMQHVVYHFSELTRMISESMMGTVLARIVEMQEHALRRERVSRMHKQYRRRRS